MSMITKHEKQKLEELIGKHAYVGHIDIELRKREIYNERTGDYYSKNYIYRICTGDRRNLMIEEVITDLILELQQSQHRIEQKKQLINQ